MQFVDSVSAAAKVDTESLAFIAAKKVEELDQTIVDEGLNVVETKAEREKR
ncbi:MAG: hypothetical protein RQ714_08995 [Nitrosomonas sp.]|nr:hypothetical protein [Nitrosomonas sp.]